MKGTGSGRYLKPVGDVGINLIDETDAVAEDVGSLTGLQIGLIDERRQRVSAGGVEGQRCQVSQSYQQGWILLPRELHYDS